VSIPLDHLAALLPNLLAFIKHIHLLWSPEARKQYVPSNFHTIFAVDEAITATLLGTLWRKFLTMLLGKEFDGKTEAGSFQAYARNLRIWLETVRDYR
jgi:hypothetical protein